MLFLSATGSVSGSLAERARVGASGWSDFKRVNFDVCFFSAYVPPVDRNGTIGQVVHTVYGEISSAISSRQICPHRPIPISGIDANGHAGMKCSRDTRSWILTDSESIGKENAEKENKMGTVVHSCLEYL